jgi:hypothetical protein
MTTTTIGCPSFKSNKGEPPLCCNACDLIFFICSDCLCEGSSELPNSLLFIQATTPYSSSPLGTLPTTSARHGSVSFSQPFRFSLAPSSAAADLCSPQYFNQASAVFKRTGMPVKASAKPLNLFSILEESLINKLHNLYLAFSSLFRCTHFRIFSSSNHKNTIAVFSSLHLIFISLSLFHSGLALHNSQKSC